MPPGSTPTRSHQRHSVASDPHPTTRPPPSDRTGQPQGCLDTGAAADFDSLCARRDPNHLPDSALRQPSLHRQFPLSYLTAHGDGAEQAEPHRHRRPPSPPSSMRNELRSQIAERSSQKA
jgi:hypothetical protein